MTLTHDKVERCYTLQFSEGVMPVFKRVVNTIYGKHGYKINYQVDVIENEK